MRLALAALALTAIGAPVPAAAGGAVQESVILVVENGSRPLRCLLLLAHFFTVETEAIPAGEAIRIGMARDPATGSLSLADARGGPMMVERVICGESGRWSQTRGDISLTPLRGGTASAYRTRCAAAERTGCTAPSQLE